MLAEKERQRDRETEMHFNRMMSFASSNFPNDGRHRNRVLKNPLPNFTGVWKQVRHENADAYLHAMGYPFTFRKLALSMIGGSTEVVSHDGEKVHMKSINRRGEWKRTYIDNQQVPMTTADGQPVTTTAWWELDETLGCYVHKTRLEGAKQGTLETWRWLDKESKEGSDFNGETQKICGTDSAGRMVVKSIVYPMDKEKEITHMYWHFEPLRQQEGSTCMLKSFEDSYVRTLDPDMATQTKQAQKKYTGERQVSLTISHGGHTKTNGHSNMKEGLASLLERFSESICGFGID